MLKRYGLPPLNALVFLLVHRVHLVYRDERPHEGWRYPNELRSWRIL